MSTPQIRDRVASQLRTYPPGRRLTAAEILNGMGDRSLQPRVVYSALRALADEKPPRACFHHMQGEADLFSRAGP